MHLIFGNNVYWFDLFKDEWCKEFYTKSVIEIESENL